MPRHTRSPPTAGDFASFASDPLGWLARAQASLGPLFLIREGGALFAPPGECSAAAAVFGAAQVRQVLSDSATFTIPSAAAGRLGLPPRLAALTRSLHAMPEPQHGVHKRGLGQLLGGTVVDTPAAQRVLHDVSRGWALQPQPLLQRMRELSLRLAEAVLLGPQADPRLAALMQQYFLLRRDAAAASHDSQGDGLLQATARALDLALRRHLRSGPLGGSRLARLLDPNATGGLELGENEAMGHANILFVSATEPVAVALTWTLLLLSQLPDLQVALRDDGALLDAVLLEGLRLLPPSGFMVRHTTQAVAVGGRLLPARCELLLSPLLAHRSATVFERPHHFLPQRWRRARPSAFEYFPFGAGAHACVGRALGMDLLRTALGFMAAHFDTRLDGEQAIDWRSQVMFMPRDEIQVRFEPAGAGAGAARGSRWQGPVAALVELGGVTADSH